MRVSNYLSNSEVALAALCGAVAAPLLVIFIWALCVVLAALAGVL
jgi:hypothetical protein